MALKIIKSNATNAYKGFRPHWYGVYRNGATVTTFNLGVLIRGEPPASGYIGDKGDEPFEASRKRAEAKFASKRGEAKDKGEAIREVATVISMKTGKRFKDPKLDTLGDLYIERIGESTPGHESTIRSGFSQFAKFAARPPKNEEPGAPRNRRAHNLGDVTRPLAVAFFQHVSANHSFSTVKKYAHRLAHIYSIIFPGTDNPFEGARRVATGSVVHEDENGEKTKIETVVHHKPLDRDQLRKLYRTAKDDGFLYPLTVTAASTGLRISDTCLLKWTSIDLNPKTPCIFLETAKTRALVGVPIFDYDPTSPNYEPDLGEFRRVLETAFAESKKGEKYVFPTAARMYLETRKTDTEGDTLPRAKWTHPGRTRICQRGKALFARALFADEPEDAELVETDEKPAPTVEDILAAIEAAEWTDERKKRIRDIYARYMNGEGYTKIHIATGHSKSQISYDISSVEELVGVKLKKKRPNQPSLVALIRKTRQERSAGRRCASIYSWHSLRGSFVLMMKEAGIDLETIKELVGHETVNTTLQYVNPTQKQAAESARQILTRRNRQQAAVEAPQTRHARTPPQLFAPNADAPRADLDALRATLAALTPEELAQLLKPAK